MNRRDALKGIFAAVIASLAPLPTVVAAAVPRTITVSMLLQVAFSAVVEHMDRPYVLSQINQLSDGTYVTYVTDPSSSKSVPLMWSAADEVSGDVINLTASLIENGIDVLDMIVSGEISG